MKKPYAEVIVDIELDILDHPFTYRIPESLQDICIPGSCVRIPFGRSGREILGYVVGLRSKTDVPDSKLKDIISVSAGGETAESRLVELAAMMSRRYGSTMIRALKTVIPVRKTYGAVTKRTVELAPGTDGEALAALYDSKRHAARARTVRALLGGPLDMSELERAARVSSAVIRGLEEAGVLRVFTSEVFRKVADEAQLTPPDTLSTEQEEVLGAIRREWSDEGNGRPVLLRGVTGSGKSVVYTELIADTIGKGRQAIVLIPEIALTRQTVLRFVRRFGDRVSFLHSRLSGGERYDQMKAARNGKISVMVGPRSALFTPFPDLGLIIVDEEHEESYHSETMPRYHAREVAVMRGKLEGANIIFGSATPSLNSAYMAESGAWLGVKLENRYGRSELPSTRIVDMREELKNGNRSILSGALEEAVRACLGRSEQVILFLNRRGYTGQITCRSCGNVIKCPHCDVSLTKHRNGRLVCHYCGYEADDITSCPECGSSYIGGITIGTEQVEEHLAAAFPGAGILRMDADTTRGKDGHEGILRSFEEGGADILIGTQMIVKGHDFPRVTLVGVLLADLSLGEADYRSSERTFQLITQAVGRAGRGERPGEAIIQTYQPDHFAVRCAAAQDYDTFYREETAFRSIMSYPPCGGMLAILGESQDEKLLKTGMSFLRKFIGLIDPGGALGAIGPAPQAIGKIRDYYREVIYVRSRDPGQLIRAKDLIEDYLSVNRGFDDIRIMFDFS
ncbi:MAG: primosomal protein N' [Lachnospiraceae bacterium]|nr:primosomal protein N' [Lachnospiraceae bacterium]